MPTPDASQFTQFKRYASVSKDALASVGSKISPFNTAYSIPMISASSQALFLPSANKEKKFPPPLPAIQVGTDITECLNEEGYKLYTFTPPTTGSYTISALAVDESDPDLYISNPDSIIDPEDIAGTSLYYSDNSGEDIITETFEGGRVYQVMVYLNDPACFQLTVDVDSS